MIQCMESARWFQSCPGKYLVVVGNGVSCVSVTSLDLLARESDGVAATLPLRQILGIFGHVQGKMVDFFFILR